MTTICWTRTSESGFECLRPVRLTVSLSHRRRSLGFLLVVVCFGGFVGFLVCFLWMKSSSFDRSWVTATCCSLMFCHITTVSAIMARTAMVQKKHTILILSNHVSASNLIGRITVIWAFSARHPNQAAAAFCRKTPREYLL